VTRNPDGGSCSHKRGKWQGGGEIYEGVSGRKEKFEAEVTRKGGFFGGERKLEGFLLKAGKKRGKHGF